MMKLERMYNYMDNDVLWYIEKQIDRTIINLRKRNMEGFFVKDNKE